MALAVEDSPHCGYKKFPTRHYSMDNGNDDRVAAGVTDEGIWDWRSYSRRADSGYCSGSTLARGIHITEFSDSRVNPTPLLLEESDILLEQYLSPGKLQLLAGVDDLKTVESLELKVDSRETSLGNFGLMLPGLAELKLNGSHIACMRDLGSSLRNLKVLWMTRCGLQELDGISAMSDLKELYLEYNEVSDVSPLSLLEHLEILDLEGNNIEDITQVQYLSLCPTLRKLALDGNPICVCPTLTHDEPGYNFRETIKKLLPNLLILDDERLDGAGVALARHNVFDEDWAYLEELQDEALLQDELPDHHKEEIESGERPPTAALRPATAYQPGSILRPSSGFRPMSTARRPSTVSGSSSSLVRPRTAASNRPASSDAIEGIESVSELTMGNVICGNPSKALRQRRQGMPGSKEDIDRRLSKLLQKGAVFSQSEVADNVLSKADCETSNIIEELRAWKLEHDKRMEVIFRSKEAQILVVNHDDDDLNNDSDDESDDDESDDKNIINDMMDNYDYRPSDLRQGHFADIQHRELISDQDGSESPSGRIYFQKKTPIHSLEEISSFVRAKTAELVGTEAADSSVDRGYRYDQSFDVEDDNLESRDFLSEASSSPTSLPADPQPIHQSAAFKESDPELSRFTLQRPFSRNQGEAGLAPLRVHSSTSAQIINRIQPKPPESPSQRQKKLRVGPTGLPLSSQTQQPVIRQNIAVIQSRSGLVHSVRPGGSQANIVLLPSQPRIRTHLPEPTILTPHPPSNV